MTINTETIRDAAEVLDTLTSILAVDHPLRTQAAARAKSCVSGLYSAADAIDAQTAEIARLRAERDALREALESVIYDMRLRAGIRGDVENGVAVLDISDGVLERVRAALAQEQGD